jgi:hypothetical protein
MLPYISSTPADNYYTLGDTLVLGITDAGKVIPVSISDMRKNAEANFLDLQSTLWCIGITGSPNYSKPPLFNFHNKAFGYDLRFGSDKAISVAPGTANWMYSSSYENGQLNHSRPVYSQNQASADDDKYRVLVWRQFANTTTGGGNRITGVDTAIVAFTNQKIPGMIKVTIVEVAPFVLDKEAFNTKFANQGDEGINLIFDKHHTYGENPFDGNKLYAEDAVNTAAGNLGYVKVKLLDENRYIYNSSGLYYNELGVKYLKLQKGNLGAANTNYDYRFVFFPSADSLVINAYTVRHSGHPDYQSNTFTDGGNYNYDNTTYPVYYGLYNETIHDALIVRRQDLYSGNGTIMTIGKNPSDVHISLGTGCNALETNAFKISEGVYTIWDTQGRVLGVRIYNGSLAPQWFVPDPYECPDRIPSYQWFVQTRSEESSLSFHRVNIINREFGNLTNAQGAKLLELENVLLLADRADRVFRGQTKYFEYGPIMQGTPNDYNSITDALITGQYLQPKSDDCVGHPTSSGFRPVYNTYSSDPHLGYKWFNVDIQSGTPGFGTSENKYIDGRLQLGMDYNAFSFNYYHDYGQNWYITQEDSYDEKILKIGSETDRAGFRFQLGTDLRATGNNYAPETFGWPQPSTSPARYDIGNDDFPVPGYTIYPQDVAKLQRYYYELKIADFYNYRDGLADQYVVLKGAKTTDKSDVRNALKYGLADVLADKDPFHFANVYLRDTYFIPKNKLGDSKIYEEEETYDWTYRTYYTIMDRIKPAQFDRLAELGAEVSDVLQTEDASSSFGVVVWGVNENNNTVKAQGKSVSSVRVSPFALRSMSYELYRRLNSVDDDRAEYIAAETPIASAGGGFVRTGLDAPRVLKIHRQLNKHEYLYEDGLSAHSYNQKGINYLGLSNADQNPEGEKYPDGLVKFNYNLFIDTAYINRGTGYIKPQYLIAVDPEWVDSVRYTEEIAIDCCDKDIVQKSIPGYRYARYLVNATDSARGPGDNGRGDIINNDYAYRTWDRFVFVPAIHDYTNDRLYILSEVKRLYPDKTKYMREGIDEDGNKKWYYDVQRLKDDCPLLTRRPIGIGDKKPYAYYDFGYLANYHNDVTFSLRFTNPKAKNADLLTGVDQEGVENDTKSFLIESETEDRTSAGAGGTTGGPKIAPVQGGWIKLYNGVVTISRTSYEDAINLPDVFNIDDELLEITGGEATSNPDIAGIKVIAGVESVSILNASGKSVTVSNLLGQTVVKTVLSSDNATIKAPKGVVVVQIEGEKAVKAVIK